MYRVLRRRHWSYCGGSLRIVCKGASDEAGYVTSQIINVDGGMFCHAPQNTGMREATERMMGKGKK